MASARVLINIFMLCFFKRQMFAQTPPLSVGPEGRGGGLLPPSPPVPLGPPWARGGGRNIVDFGIRAAFFK